MSKLLSPVDQTRSWPRRVVGKRSPVIARIESAGVGESGESEAAKQGNQRDKVPLVLLTPSRRRSYSCERGGEARYARAAPTGGRRRSEAPTKPKPATSMAQVAGSGTPPVTLRFDTPQPSSPRPCALPE